MDADLPPRPPDDLAWLTRAVLTVVGRFGDASNATLLVHLGEPGQAEPPPEVTGLADLDGRHWAVYKPRLGEAPLWDFPDGTLHLREVAAFVVDRALGWGMVPPTVVREDAEHGVGSVQLFVPHDPEQHFFALVESSPAPGILRQLERMVAFDAVIENADRKGGHVLRDDADRLWLVDHGVAFHDEPHLRTVAWHLAGEALPEQDRRDVAALADRLVPGTDLDARLRSLLSRDERAALRHRARALADRGTYPHPTTQRPMPWPLI